MNILKSVGIMFFLLSFAVNGFSQETIRLTNAEWVPYHSKDLKYFGVGSRIVTEAFALENVKVEYGWFPWARAKVYAEEGEWDGCVAWAMVPTWEDIFYFSDEPVYEGIDVFFHLKSYPFEWETVNDLTEIPMGGIIGYTYTGILEEPINSGQIEMQRVPTELQNFKKLLAGRIKIYPENMEAGYYMLNSNFPPDTVELFTHHPKPLRKLTYHLILSKKIERNKRMIDLFNKGLKQLKESGKFDQFLAESRRGEYMKK